MEHRGFRATLVAAAVGAALATVAGTATASGFAIGTQNASGLGNAYAGQAASAEDASAVFYNPAGMTALPGRQMVGAINLLKPSIKFNNSGSTSPTSPLPSPPGIALGSNGGDAGGWAAVPAGYLSWEVMPSQLWLGIGVSSPFGLTTDWDSGWIGRFHAQKSELLTININPSIAWKINQMFSVGGGINAQYIDAELTRQVAYGAITLGRVLGNNPAGCGVGVGALLGGCGTEGQFKVKVDDWSWGWNLGAMVNFSPDTRLGISYRSTIKHKIEGDATFSNVPNYAALGAAGAPLVAALANGNVTADLKVPDMLSVGVAHGFGRWQVLADYTWTGWDSVQTVAVNRTSGAASGSTIANLDLQFKNSYRVGLGVNYRLNDQWKLRVGTAYDKTPVQDQFRSPALPDESRIWAAIGAQWQFSKQGALDFGYAHEFIDDASSNLPSQATPTDVPRGNLVGTYKANVNILGVQLRYNF